MNKRIDVHTHIWEESDIPPQISGYDSSRSLSCDADALIAAMDKNGIDLSIAVALAYEPDLSDTHIRRINDFVLRECNKYPERLIPFCCVNPRSPQAAKIVAEALANGHKGLKFHGAFQNMGVDDPQLWPIYKVLEEAQKPVLFHSGDIGVLPLNDQYTSVNRFDSVFCDFPQLPAILGHAGRIDFSRTAGLLRKHSNVYVDISSVIGRDPNFQTYPLRDLITKAKTWAGAVDRILFGSDMPLYSYEKTLGNLDLLIAELQETPDPVISIDDVVAIRDVNSSAFLNRYQL